MNILKKNMTLTAFVFPKLRTLKTWLDKCLKSPVSEDRSTSNTVNVPEHCWNLHHSTFIIFIVHWHRNCNRKNLLYWHAKSWDCMLTYWLPVKIKRKFSERIQMQLSQKQKYFSGFFAAFLKSRLNSKYFEKKDDPHTFSIFEVTDSEIVVR